ncbi:protein serine/threonine phosphatase PrpC, regulation of stationary phase [Lachnospiraceae bacterium KM106-2]|nr:protein serine/threonine phosphatase PrpC, regulation of stationary phase [Lachnospiraceae bacterium KM106-2]
MLAYSKTDIGRLRKVNQDAMYCCNEPIGSLSNLFIVADGMGGHNAGDYASRCCVESVVNYVRNSRNVTPVSILEGAIKEANNRVLTKALSDKNYEGMGTTLVAATVAGNKMIVANIGDSRLYVIDDSISQITCDHSLVEAMVQSGEIDAKEAKNHPNKNVITRAIGTDQSVKADFFEIDLKKGNLILLCSDGLTNMLDDEEILRITKQFSNNLEEAATHLIDKANENGGKDNIAIVIMKV